MKRLSLAFAAGLAVMALAASQPAAARDHGHGHGYGHGYDHGYDHGWHGGPHVSLSFNVWRGGYWNHGWYGSRFGWWWVVPSAGYYYYSAPIYPYPNYYEPPRVIVQQQPVPATGVPPQQYWYHCDDPEGYYPYVSECRHDWRQVPATPPGK
jgi:hypothetical protein